MSLQVNDQGRQCKHYGCVEIPLQLISHGVRSSLVDNQRKDEGNSKLTVFPPIDCKRRWKRRPVRIKFCRGSIIVVCRSNHWTE